MTLAAGNSPASLGAINPDWTDQNFLDQAFAWIMEQTDHLAIPISGPITQLHVRPWSTVFVVPTESARLLFKATIAAWIHEARLTHAISRWSPALTPEVLAADLNRNWLLMRDGGTSLRTVLKQDGDSSHWARAIRRYAHLQQSLVPRAPNLIALGAADRRLEGLPEQFIALLADSAAVRLGKSDGLTDVDHQALVALIPLFKSQCARLADFGIAETIQHDDLHDNNILLNSGEGEPYLFFDWGDSCVGHPFFSLVVALRSVGWTLGEAQAEALRDTMCSAYLAAWSDLLSQDDLKHALQLALKIGIVCRTLTWHRLLPGIDPTFESDLSGYVARWLKEYLAVSQP